MSDWELTLPPSPCLDCDKPSNPCTSICEPRANWEGYCEGTKAAGQKARADEAWKIADFIDNFYADKGINAAWSGNIQSCLKNWLSNQGIKRPEGKE